MSIMPIIGILLLCAGFALLYHQRNIHHERMILEYRFQEIQNHCVNADAKTRLMAASQLKEMSGQCSYGKGKTATPENYPFFARAMGILCIMISQETEREVIDVMQGMLESAVRFSTNHPRFLSNHSDKRLRHSLVNQLQEAHEAAEKSLIKAMMTYWDGKSESQNSHYTEIFAEIMGKIDFAVPIISYSGSYSEVRRRQLVAALFTSSYLIALLKRSREKIKSSMADRPEQMKSEAALLAEMQLAADRYLTVKYILDYGTNHKDTTMVMELNQ